MNRPLISIITSTFNWPAVLRLAMQSALAQSFTDFEYIIVGDGCTDETEEIVRGSHDPRIVWTNLPENTGNQSKPNQVGLEMARGELIAYLNHDDLWFPDHLETLLLAARSKDVDIVNSLCIEIAPPGQRYRGVLGLPFRAEDSIQPAWPMTTCIMHTAKAGRAVGGWRDWRQLTEVPTLELFRRLRQLRGAYTIMPRVTALKFHSADRKNSYKMKDAKEQSHYAAQMEADPQLRHHLLAEAMVCFNLGIRPRRLPLPDKPENAPPGWEIEQWRRNRGLEPMIDLGEASDEKPTI